MFRTALDIARRRPVATTSDEHELLRLIRGLVADAAAGPGLSGDEMDLLSVAAEEVVVISSLYDLPGVLPDGVRESFEAHILILRNWSCREET